MPSPFSLILLEEVCNPDNVQMDTFEVHVFGHCESPLWVLLRVEILMDSRLHHSQFLVNLLQVQDKRCFEISVTS